MRTNCLLQNGDCTCSQWRIPSDVGLIIAGEIFIASFFQRLDHVYFPSSPIAPFALGRIFIPGHGIPSLLPLHHLLRPDLRYRLRMHSRPNNPSPQRRHRHARPLQQRHLRSPTPLQQSLLLLLQAQLLLLRQCCLQRHPLLHPTSTRPTHLPLPRLQPDPALLRQRNRHHLQHAFSRRQQPRRQKFQNHNLGLHRCEPRLRRRRGRANLRLSRSPQRHSPPQRALVHGDAWPGDHGMGVPADARATQDVPDGSEISYLGHD